METRTHKRPHRLRMVELQESLSESIFSGRMIYRECVGSTNTVAKEAAADGAPEGTLVLCEQQTAGRGRLGRKWMSSAQCNLLFSVLLRPRLPPEEVFVLTMVAALAAAETVESVCGLKVQIKWPNDLYAGGKKLGGILTEFTARGSHVAYAVIGMGLNVNWFPPARHTVRYRATSIRAETGRAVSREGILAEILKRLETGYRAVQEGETTGVYGRWNARVLFLGERVKIVEDGLPAVSGRALRVDRSGALVLLDDEGRERRILSGEVSASGAAQGGVDRDSRH